MVPKIFSTWEKLASIENLLTEKTPKSFQVKEYSNADFKVFNALDTEVILNLPWANNYQFFNAKLAILSYSTNRAHYPVTSLGYGQVKGFSKGTALVAGSFVFNFLGLSPWRPAIQEYVRVLGADPTLAERVQVDELPPMDMSFTIINESGSMIRKYLTNFILVDSSTTIDMNQPNTYEAYSFMAEDISNWELVKA